MDNEIILVFNFFNNPSFDKIFNYCNRFSDNSRKEVQKIIKKLVKNNNLKQNDLTRNYVLTIEGKYILNQLNIYYKRIIIAFYRKYNITNYKKYALKEIRTEQNKLINYLKNNYPNICSFCDKRLPYFLLETAHIKPRYLLQDCEKLNYNNVIFLCRYCHVIFDKGLISVHNNKLLISDKLNINDFDLPKYKNDICFEDQKKFFNFHYNYIYIK